MSKSKEVTYFANAKTITKSLLKTFGKDNLGNKQNPFDELLFIILSSKTPPDRYRKTYKSLKSKYPLSEMLANAKPYAIARVIKFGGLEEKKANQISAIAKQLKKKFGKVSLNPLKKMSNENAEKILVELPGIGIKSARCVLMYSLNRKVFPADNHCLRISRRLMWISTNDGFSKGTANYLQERIPPNLRKDLHVGMVLLGRKYCLPKNPKCQECPILFSCPTGKGPSPNNKCQNTY